MKRIDLQDLASADRWTHVKRFLTEEALTPFDTVRGPPLRATALSVYENEIVLVLSMHHAACDGIGASRVLVEMAELYSAKMQSRAAKLEAVAPFVHALRTLPEWLAKEVVPAGEPLWRGLFPDRLESLALEKLRREGAPALTHITKSLRGARAHLDVKASVLTALKKKAQASNTTVFMNLFASWGALIAEITGTRSFALPVPLAARGQKGTCEQVANWVNLMPLPVRTAPGMRYSELLAHTRKVMMVAYAAMDYPASRLTDWLREEGKWPSGAFPQVSFNLEPAPKSPKFANAEASLMGFPVVASEFPIMVNITEVAGLLLLDADYQLCEFEEADVMLLLERYRTLLERVARAENDGDPTIEELVRFEEKATDAKRDRYKKRIAGLG